MQNLVKILPNGAVLIGENFTVDGHYERPFRIVTHFHSDHTIGLEKSIITCNGVIATPLTLEILSIDYPIPPRKTFGLNYDIKMTFEDESIILKKSDHVMGSAQVLVKLRNGLEVGYTGDFKNPEKGTPILHPDILIMEATYGKPEFRRPFKNDIESLFADYVKDALIYGPVRIYGYHGKLQEVMVSLRKMGIDAPFITSGKISKMTKIAIKHGYNITQVFDETEAEAKEIMRDSWYIIFSHYNEFKRRNGNYFNFLLSGWEFRDIVRKLDSKSYIVSFSDHADFDDLIYYASTTSAKYIITDGGRKSYAKELADYISRKLGKVAISMP
ncbi:MBL fold metallo-hydrolase [Sulfolobus tengchongensis]|uniref:MBL fold metallo-hydrolase n=1 Tax=Sulfolobus tengchongensis TaxID=207809 RepID=A0AAX4KYU1_9CREN